MWRTTSALVTFSHPLCFTQFLERQAHPLAHTPPPVQRNTLDEHLHSKSRVEEANMVWYQRNHARMEQLQQLLQQ